MTNINVSIKLSKNKKIVYIILNLTEKIEIENYMKKLLEAINIEINKEKIIEGKITKLLLLIKYNYKIKKI